MLRTIIACVAFLASSNALVLPGVAPQPVQVRTSMVNMQGAHRLASRRTP